MDSFFKVISAYPRPAMLRRLIVFEQLPGLDFKPLSDARDIVDRDVSLRTLYAAKVGAIDPAFVRERFLA